MPTLSDVFRNAEAHGLLAFFDPVDLDLFENTLFEKNGKPYLTCLATGKEKLAKPEEVVRQLWLARLLEKYRYPKSRIQIEYPVTFGRDTSKRADIVVMDADRPTVPYLIVEVKQGKFKDGKEQLRSYTHATGAPLALWCNGEQAITWHRKNPNYFVVIPDIPAVSQTIDDIAGTPWTVDALIEIEKRREAEGKGAPSLKLLIEDMEDEVLANAGVDVFEEVFKLIFTKLYDEMYCFRGRHKFLRFRNSNTAAQLKANIQALFDDAKKQWPGVFADDEKIKLGPEHLQVCVGSLEEWKLFNSNLDVVDEAFEYLVNKSSKGEKGQYFTPRWVIDLCVRMMNPTETETVIDTAAGSAGFTVHAIFHVWKKILEDEGLPVSHLFTMEDKPQRCKDYVQDKVFAVDFDEKSVRVARCLNLIAGDGQTNVLHLNTLDWTKWDERIKEDEDWQETYGPGWAKLKKLRAAKNDNRAFQFDVLMANPPFAGDIKQSDMLSPYELGHKENGKLETKVGRDLLFIERNLDFLRPGGRMAIVLPQGRFNNASDKRVREFISERCRILAVVGLHPNTFKPHTGTKTSVLFVQKWHENAVDPRYHCPKREDYPIFFATQKLESKDTSGEKIIAKGQHGKLLRDGHGHWVIQHDLFNHDGLTQDGIAEAFQEFAAKECLSFAETKVSSGQTEWPQQSLDVSIATPSARSRVTRLDAEYFSPRVTALLHRLNRGGRILGDVATVRRERFLPGKTGNFEYIEISGVRNDGTAEAEAVPHQEAPSRAAWIVHTGDVITSMVRPIRRLSALIAPDQDGHVCSSGFVVLRPKNIAAEVLLTYLRLPTVCELLDLHTSASLYPAISESDLLSIPIPSFDEGTQSQIVTAVQAAHDARRQTAELLAAAKRAVEIAVESSETPTMEFLTKTMKGEAE